MNEALLTQKRYDRRASSFDAMAWAWERFLAAKLRRRLWDGVEGRRVLEVGVGTGKNLEYHPAGMQVDAIDLSPRMLRRAAGKARESGSTCGLRLADVQSLPFRSASFDSVVATFVFCSVPDPVAGLREIRRVVRPGGVVHLLEQVRIDRPAPLGWLTDLADPIILRPFGAHVGRRTARNVERAGLELLADEPHGLFGFVRLIRARAG